MAGSLLTLTLVGSARYAESALQSLAFPTGWLAVLCFGLLALGWTARNPDEDALRQRFGTQAVWTVFGLALLLVHMDSRAPSGPLGMALAAGVAALVLSLIVGWTLTLGVRDGGSRESLRRWHIGHLGLSFGLLALGVVHGVVLSAHGLLAYVVLGRES
ncbi:hypothetical protein [Engelhardtia mirabilis]|uniref:hypothetical protein n=1 Tax=Engelhardtia mirabilis TaxID=2528011 RepID=UPI0011A4A9A9